MSVDPVTTLEDPRLAWYRGVSDPSLLREGGRFVAEGRTTVARLLADRDWEVESVLVSPAAAEALAPALGARPDVTVFVLPPDRLSELAGFNIHRGCLAIGRRRAAARCDALVPDVPHAVRLLGLEGLADADNVGACFRNAAAFGVSAVLLDEACADPLYRKAIRTSTAATLRVPYARGVSWPETVGWLQARSVTVIGLTPAVEADDLAVVREAVAGSARLALLAGTEGTGLSAAALARCDRLVRIPMAPGVDSLNVATAVAIALYALVADDRRTDRGQDA